MGMASWTWQFASQSSDVVTILFGNSDGTFKGHIEYSFRV